MNPTGLRTEVTRYQKRISGPLMDRIDIPCRCRGWNQKLRDMRQGESSTEVRVEAARKAKIGYNKSKLGSQNAGLVNISLSGFIAHRKKWNKTKRRR